MFHNRLEGTCVYPPRPLPLLDAAADGDADDEADDAANAGRRKGLSLGVDCLRCHTKCPQCCSEKEALSLEVAWCADPSSFRDAFPTCARRCRGRRGRVAGQRRNSAAGRATEHTTRRWRHWTAPHTVYRWRALAPFRARRVNTRSKGLGQLSAAETSNLLTARASAGWLHGPRRNCFSKARDTP